jgi:hypothetical protein
MNSAKIFEGLSQSQEKAYAAEAERLYDRDTVRASNKQWQGYGKDKQQAIMDEGNQIYAAIAAAIPQGADSPAVQALVQRWRDHIEYFWVPQLEQLEGLARIYSEDARFKANFDKVDPQLAVFMLHAVQHYVRQRQV